MGSAEMNGGDALDKTGNCPIIKVNDAQRAASRLAATTSLVSSQLATTLIPIGAHHLPYRARVCQKSAFWQNPGFSELRAYVPFEDVSAGPAAL
jgi:hypothetical protein